MKQGMAGALALCIVLSGLGIGFVGIPVTGTEDAGHVVSALTPHAPIRINSDADFTLANGVVNAATGDGSAGNPWVLENWSIEGVVNLACIFIANTTEYFTVMNCSLANASGQMLTPDGLGGGIVIVNSDRGYVKNNTLYNNSYGILLYNTRNCTVTQNNASGNNDNGVKMEGVYNATIQNNTIINNIIGLNITTLTPPNKIFHNSIINNTVQFIDDGAYYWDAGYPVGGNYWDDYAGADANGDGIGDTPYIIDGDSSDRYPLDAPYVGQQLGETVPPYAVGWGPDASDAPVNSQITIQWNETLDWTSVENAFGYTDNVTVRTSANGSWAHDAATNTSTFTPAVELEPGVEYWVSVNVTATDLAGNELDQNQSGTGGEWPADILIWNFTTFIESTPPRALNYTPTGIVDSVFAQFVINWSETMNWTSVEEAFQYTDTVDWYNSTNGTWVHNASTNVSVFTPDFLEWETTYGVMINHTAADVVGNMLDQDNDTVAGEFPDDVVNWVFDTIDAPPTVVSTTPVNMAGVVDPNTNIVVEFSESMNRSSVEAGFMYSDGVDDFNITNGTVLWGILDKIMTFDPFEPLVNDTMYDVTIAGNSTDLNGNMLDGNQDDVPGDDYTFVFTTWLEAPAPSVEYVIPSPNATMVNVDTYVKIKFDFGMNTTSVEEAFSITDGDTVLDADNGEFSWTTAKDIMTFLPRFMLRYDTEYEVRLLGTAKSYVGKLIDNNHNDIGEGSPVEDYVFTFTTSPEPPVVISTSPANGVVNIPVDLEAIIITFDRAMNNASVINAFHISPNVLNMKNWSADSRELTITMLANLSYYTDYTVSISGDTATDRDGVWLDGDANGAYGDDYQFRFQTEGAPDTQPPELLRVLPPNEAEMVRIDTYIQAEFNETMNKTSVEEAFTMSSGTAFINGTFVWEPTGAAFRFYPTDNLTENSTYTCTIGTGCRDLAGNALQESYTWTFITGTEIEKEKEPIDEFWYYLTVIFILVILLSFTYLKNRQLVMELRKTRVENKKMRRRLGERPAAAGKASAPEKVAEGGGAKPDEAEPQENTSGDEYRGEKSDEPDVAETDTPPENKEE